MARPRPVLLLAGALTLAVLVVKVPEAAPPTIAGVDPTAYVSVEGVSQDVSVLAVPAGAQDATGVVEERTGAEVLQTQPLASLGEGGFETTGEQLVLDRVVTPEQVQAVAEVLGETRAGTRTAVAAHVLVPDEEDRRSENPRRVNESIGVDGAGLVEAYHLTRRDGKLDVQLLDTLPPGVGLEDVLSALAAEYGVARDELEVLPLEGA